jgi:acetyl esterase/lipase
MRLYCKALVLFWLVIVPRLNAQGDFYQVTQSDLDHGHHPGDLIRSQIINDAPDGASAYRVLYLSTGLHNEPIAVSGVVIIPGGTEPFGGRSIVAWAHPTSGIVPRCAPSLARVLFNSIQGLPDMLARGYIVAATDYPGLGTAGPHPYLVGISEGRAVLDSVRATRSIGGIRTRSTFSVWGHSQGGQAALFAGILAESYAPELHLVGVAAAAPATELAILLSDDIDTSGGRNLTSMTLWSWSRVYGASMDAVVTPEAIPIINRLANLCIERFFDILTRRGPTRALDRSFLKVKSFADKEPWRSLLAQNTPGLLPRNVPVFLAQGTADKLVRPQVTLNYAAKLCRSGNSVQLYLMPGEGHAFAARRSASVAVKWISDRFAGRPAPSNCGGSL